MTLKDIFDKWLFAFEIYYAYILKSSSNVLTVLILDGSDPREFVEMYPIVQVGDYEGKLVLNSKGEIKIITRYVGDNISILVGNALSKPSSRKIISQYVGV